MDQACRQASLSRTDEPLHPQLFAKAISGVADEDAIFAVDVGECTVWVARQMAMTGDRRMVGGFNHGSPGGGLPTALGAAALDPSRQIWTLCGDGVRVEHAEDILPAIQQAIASDKPFIIDAIVSSGELVMPPHVEIGEVYGFGVSKIKEGLIGLKGDHRVWKAWRDELMGFLS